MRDFAQTVAAAQALGTDVVRGLDAAQVERSRIQYGGNRLAEVGTRSIASIFYNAITDKTLLILLGAAVLSIVVELVESAVHTDHSPHYLDGIAILCAVAIASLVTTLNEARAAKEFRALSKVRSDVGAKVLREDHVVRISTFDLVVGDIVYFDTGDRLPADGKLLAGVDVQVDQSMLTGESMPVKKTEADLELLGGTIVTGGHGRMLLESVGAGSEIGKLQLTLTETEEAPTPLQDRLSRLADRIGLFGLLAAVLTFLALAISGFARGTLPMRFALGTGAQLLEFLIVAVTIVVVAVPEGLPLAVTISLAYSVRKMAKAKNLVRKLASCETMGAATCICTDKTGTLTRNRMSVVAARVGGIDIDQGPTPGDLSAEDFELFADIASIDSTAFLETRDGMEQYVGNPTECALLSLVTKWGVDWRRRRSGAEIVHQYGFTSDRKRMSTLVRRGREHFLLVKGAPEVVIGLSGDVEPSQREALLAAVNDYSAKGHRTLALAYRRLPDQPDESFARPEEMERSLSLLAVVAIADPIRPEVRGAIAKIRDAGVDVKIVTGDNPLTARTIAEQVGLIDADAIVMEGVEFREKTDEELLPNLDHLRILARTIPSDKHRLVNLLKRSGQVVAVTGDGTNDAPALKAADVGFAMGLSGTEVAKEASDIVILDDNFASIVVGIQWGRSIFENIRKFIQFQLTVNVVALTTAFLAAVLGFGIPLNTVQLLWVNLIMDTMAALALATEPPGEELFHQPPHGRHAPLITRSMWINIFVMGGLMIAVLFAVMETDWVVPAATPHPAKLTFVFNTFVMMQVFNELNARSTRFDRGVFRNLGDSPLFLVVVMTTVAVQAVIVQYGGTFFRTVPLDPDLWMRSLIIGVSILGVGAALRAGGRVLL